MVEEEFESLTQPSLTICLFSWSLIDCYKMDIFILFNEIFYQDTYKQNHLLLNILLEYQTHTYM